MKIVRAYSKELGRVVSIDEARVEFFPLRKMRELDIDLFVQIRFIDITISLLQK